MLNGNNYSLLTPQTVLRPSKIGKLVENQISNDTCKSFIMIGVRRVRINITTLLFTGAIVGGGVVTKWWESNVLTATLLGKKRRAQDQNAQLVLISTRALFYRAT